VETSRHWRTRIRVLSRFRKNSFPGKNRPAGNPSLIAQLSGGGHFTPRGGRIHGSIPFLEAFYRPILQHLRRGSPPGPDKRNRSNQRAYHYRSIDPLHSPHFSEPDSQSLKQQASRRALEKVLTLPPVKIRQKYFKIFVRRDALSTHLKKLLDIW